jgi:hypothetical protein
MEMKAIAATNRHPYQAQAANIEIPSVDVTFRRCEGPQQICLSFPRREAARDGQLTESMASPSISDYLREGLF